jgi:hypothetical protein
MKHRHLTHEGYTLAAIEDVLARGSIPDWAPLVREIQAQPDGEIARRVERVCAARGDIYGASKLFRRVIATARRANAA